MSMLTEWQPVFAATTISSCAELQSMEEHLNSSYVLTTDIDCNGYSFEPVGQSTAFTGSLDGNGYEISNLTIGYSTFGGLFGRISGSTIQNLRLSNVTVTGYEYVGALAGYASDSTISNVSVDYFNIEAEGTVGGLIGEAESTIIERSYSSNGTITVENRYGGGLVGTMFDGALIDVYSRDSQIQSIMGESLGGIVGQLNVNDPVGYSNIYSNNTVDTYFYGGGIVGMAGGTDVPCVFSNMFFAGTATASSAGGDLIGYASANCYAENSMTTGSTCVGEDQSTHLTSCTTGVSEADFYSASNAPLSSWDFDTVWETTLSFPQLQWTSETFAIAPVNVTTESSDTTVTLNWTNFADANFDSVTIRRSTTGYPATVTDGTGVASNVIATTYVDTGLVSGTRYYYSLFSKSTSGNYSLPENVYAITGRNACLLKAYWKFDATAATPADATGNGYNGTGTATELSEDVPTTGFINPYSYAFNGTTARVSVSRPVSNDFTICAWIKTTAQGAGVGGEHYKTMAIAHAETAFGANDFGFGMDANERLMFGNGNGSTDYGVHGSTVINTGSWTHVCTTREKSNGAIKLYVNGTHDGSGTGSTTSLTSNATMTIGYGTDGGLAWNGLIDDVRVYEYVLFASEIADIADGINACFGEATPRPIVSSSSSNDVITQSTGGGRGKGGTQKIVDTLQSRMSSSASSSSSTLRSSSPARPAAPTEMMSATMKERTCSRVTKWFTSNESMFGRVNARLLQRFGFECEE